MEVCAKYLRDHHVTKTTEAIQKTTDATREQVKRIDESISTVGQGVRDLNDQYEGIDSRILELTERQHYISQQVTDALSSQNGMYQMLKDAVLSKLTRTRKENCAAHSSKSSISRLVAHGPHRIRDHLPQVSSTHSVSRICKKPMTW